MDNINNQSVINNEYDYSNCLPTVECVTYLVKYMSEVYDAFIKRQMEDEARNKQFKNEYKEWKYRRSYAERFEIYIREKAFNNLTCKNFASFQSAVENGNLKNISGMAIKMDLDYKRGIGENLEDYDNSFCVSFEPNNITFARKSDHIEPDMDQIEKNIKTILEGFPTLNTIFCTK